jgi:hypothetical protein
LLWRVLVLAVQLYLTADYCDPLVPGVFSFDNPDSFFVESTEARPAMPVLASPVMRALLPVREVLEPVARRVTATAPPHARLDRYASRAYVAVSPPPAPESSDDH